MENLRKDVKQQEKPAVKVKNFMKAVKKYTDMPPLDAKRFEGGEKIYISAMYAPGDSAPRGKVRGIQIGYPFLGAFDFEQAREPSQAAQKIAKAGVA